MSPCVGYLGWVPTDLLENAGPIIYFFLISKKHIPTDSV